MWDASLQAIGKGPQSIQALAIALSFPPELDGKPLLLRIPHSWLHGETKVGLSGKLPQGLVSAVPDGVMQTANEENSASFSQRDSGELSDDLPDKLHPLVQQWQDKYGGNQLLCGWIWCLLPSRELMPGSIDLVKGLCLGRSWGTRGEPSIAAS